MTFDQFVAKVMGTVFKVDNKGYVITPTTIVIVDGKEREIADVFFRGDNKLIIQVT